MIARRGRAALTRHFGLALAGLSTPLWIGFFIDEAPVLFFVMLIAAPLGVLGLGRAFDACRVAHVVELDASGLHIAWGTRVFAMPWLARHDREIPWSALQSVRIHTVLIGGLATTNLCITTAGDTLEVPDDRFDRSAYLIQRDILDFVERGRPRAAPSAIANRMRERFAEPQCRARSPWGMSGASIFFLPFIAYPVWLAIAYPSWWTHGFAAAAVGLYGWLAMLGWRNWWQQRVLCLGPDGLAVGPSEARSRLIRWDEVRLVRRETTNGKLDAIDIVEHDGTRTSLRHDYGYGLTLLARLVDPHR